MTAIDEYYPFDAGAGANITEAQWVKMAQHWRSDGVLPGVGNGLTVSPNAGLVLNVATGAVWIKGAYGGITSTKTVTLSAAHATLARIDLVVMRRDAVANTVTVEVLTGTAAASPVAPTLTQVVTATYEISLAQIAVAATATSITADNITDVRTVFEAGQQTQPNLVHNPSGRVAQRGTSISVGAAQVYTLDRWFSYRAGLVAGMTVSQQAGVGDVQGDNYCMRLQRDNANASTATLGHIQTFTTVDSRRLAGKKATFSFRARKGALYSAASNALVGSIYYGTGTDQSLGSGLTGQVTLGTVTATLSGTWQTYSVTVDVPATATQLAIQLSWTPVGTAGATDYADVKDVRVDEGAAVLPHVSSTYGQELADCQRFFWRCGGASSSDNITPAQVTAATTAVGWIRHPVPMRANATLTVSGPTTFTVNDVAAAPATTAVALDGGTAQTVHGASVLFTAGGGGLTVGRIARVYANAGYLDLSAEI